MNRRIFGACAPLTFALAALLALPAAGASRFETFLQEIVRFDAYTGRHSRMSGRYALHLARLLGLPAREAWRVHRFATLHDLGKTRIPLEILNKPGKLSDDEWKVMKTHPVQGADLLTAAGERAEDVAAVRYHHERWDGSGYPEGLAGEKIPRVARITAVADVFSALVTDRPYRPGFPFEKACEMMEGMAGKDLDPAMVRRFLEDREALKAIQALFPKN